MMCWFHRWAALVPRLAEVAEYFGADPNDFDHHVPFDLRDRVCSRCGAVDPRLQRILRGARSIREADGGAEPGALTLIITGGRKP